MPFPNRLATQYATVLLRGRFSHGLYRTANLQNVTGRMLIAGGNVAGVSAAIAARKHDQEMEIVLVEESNFALPRSQGSPGTIGQEDAFPRPASFNPQLLRSQYRVDVRLGHLLEAVDLESKVVQVVDAAHGRAYKLAFRELVFATGARNKELQVPRDEVGPSVVGAHSWEAMDKAIEISKDGNKPTVLIVGGSLDGAELVDPLLKNGLRVVVLTDGPTAVDGFDPAIGRLAETALRSSGADVYLDASIESIDETGVSSDAGFFDCQLVLLASELYPNTEVAQQAALPLGEKGALLVNGRQEVAEGVWAAGNCCDCFHIVVRKRGYYPSGQRPALEGATAGINAAGGYRISEGVVDVVAGRVSGLTIARCGIDAHAAQLVGYSCEELVIQPSAENSYLHGKFYDSRIGSGLFSKLFLERGTSRILGAQLAGPPVVEGCIDLLALAVTKGISLEELMRFDLGYAKYLREHA